MSDVSAQTYEEATAQKQKASIADPIHYNPKYSYRNQPYRFLSHQKGKIGSFKVQLMEAKSLKRRHWSVLSLGPVKRLGLSQAHGDVSSFAMLQLFYKKSSNAEIPEDQFKVHQSSSNISNATNSSETSWKIQSIASVVSSQSPSRTPPRSNVKVQSAAMMKSYLSSIVRSNSNPIWPSKQTSQNSSIFELDLEKNVELNTTMDSELHLSIQMREEWTRTDAIIPVKGGDGLLGEATINLNFLLRRAFGNNGSLDFDEIEKSTGAVVNECDGDSVDMWVSLSCEQVKDKSESSGGNSPRVDRSLMETNECDECSKVRIKISYEPFGMKPRRGDIVALESFARQSSQTSAFRPILHPFHPLKVKDLCNDFLLCTYELPLKYLNASDDFEGSESNTIKTVEGSIRVHRNCCFVIERTNVIDSAVNIVLTPTDAVLATPLGQTVKPLVDITGVYCVLILFLCKNNTIYNTKMLNSICYTIIGAAIKPALVSSKLAVEAAKIGGVTTAKVVSGAVNSIVDR